MREAVNNRYLTDRIEAALGTDFDQTGPFDGGKRPFEGTARSGRSWTRFWGRTTVSAVDSRFTREKRKLTPV